jgi:hypothetical protein
MHENILDGATTKKMRDTYEPARALSDAIVNYARYLRSDGWIYSDIAEHLKASVGLIVAAAASWEPTEQPEQ